MPKAAIIWDVEGTLVDTAELHFHAWAKLAAEIGRPFTRADFAATFGRRNPEIIRALFDSNATDAAAADLGERKEHIYRTAAPAAAAATRGAEKKHPPPPPPRREGVALLPGVRELLDGIKALGWRQ